MASQLKQVYTNMANVIKGPSQIHRLTFSAKISANVLYDLPWGRMVHINDSGEIEPGVVRWQMGMMLMRGALSLDVNNAGGYNYEFQPVTPSGSTTCIVCSGGFEMWTTEYDTLQSYTPNQPLRAPIGNAANQSAVSGVLTNQTVYAISDFIANGANKYTAICGLVSKAPYTTALGQSVLPFWTVWYPGHPTE